MTSVETSDSPLSEVDLERRQLLQRLAAGASLAVAAGGPALAQDAAPAAPAAGGAPRPEPTPDATTAKFVSLMSELSNWNRWGPDDQMGTINLITPAIRRAAAALVREGVSFSMERDIELKKSVDNPQPMVLDVFHPGKGQTAKSGYTGDALLVNYHNFVVSHMNALAHFFWDGKLYNGVPVDTVTVEDGAQKNNIMAFKNGVVTRGVLMDMARHKGVDWLEPGDAIFPEDLEAWEKKAGIKVRTGDIMYVRTGRSLRREKLGPWPLNQGLAGIHMDVAKWMHDRGVVVSASDGDQDCKPSRVTGIGSPIHTLCLVAMGMPVFDEVDLELVGQEAAKRKRWEFLTIAAPLAIPGGTGSAINPIAVF